MVYSLSDKRIGRRNFTLFSAVNAFSFTLLIGNIVTLYMIELDASDSFKGLVASFIYIALFMLIPSKILQKRFGVMKTMAGAWALRSVVSVPMIVSVLVVYFRGDYRLGREILFASQILFHICRGVGLSGNSPLMNVLSEGKDRGSFLAMMMAVNHMAIIFTLLLVSFVMSISESLLTYLFFFLGGIVSGFFSSWILTKIKEPPINDESVQKPIITSFKELLSKKNTRLFVISYALFFFLAAIIRSFIIVYAREVFAFPNSTATLFSIFGSLGIVTMGLLTRRLFDFIGAKPMIIIFHIVSAVALLPLLLPISTDGSSYFLILSLVFFFYFLGSVGSENGFQSYYYSFIFTKGDLNLGVIYFLLLSFGGVGLIFAGIFLDILTYFTNDNAALKYQIFFIVWLVLSQINLAIFSRLERRGAHKLPAALACIFSLREWRGFVLIDRLNHKKNFEEERKIIKNLGLSRASLGFGEVIKKLDAPNADVRLEAISALESAPVTEEFVAGLMNQLDKHPHTTAPSAAAILGRRGIKESTLKLMECINSSNKELSAQSMIALGQLRHTEAFDKIHDLVMKSTEPKIVLYGINALGLLGNENYFNTLIGLKDHPLRKLPDFDEEFLFALARSLSIAEDFYLIYAEYLEYPESGLLLLREKCSDASLPEDFFNVSFYQQQFPALEIEKHIPENSRIAPLIRDESLLATPFLLFCLLAEHKDCR